MVVEHKSDQSLEQFDVILVFSEEEEANFFINPERLDLIIS